jgi:hypothetical protein
LVTADLTEVVEEATWDGAVEGSADWNRLIGSRLRTDTPPSIGPESPLLLFLHPFAHSPSRLATVEMHWEKGKKFSLANEHNYPKFTPCLDVAGAAVCRG